MNRARERAQHADMLLERRLDREERACDLGAVRAAEDGQVRRAAVAADLARELRLPLAHLLQVAAALHKGVDLGEDRRPVELPLAPRILALAARLDRLDGRVVQRAPRVARGDRLREGVGK